MTATIKRWRVLAYISGAVYLFGFALLIVSYEWLRQPNGATGEVLARIMQQPFNVYLTKAEYMWLDWGPVVLLPLLGTALWATRRWKKARSNEDAQHIQT